MLQTVFKSLVVIARPKALKWPAAMAASMRTFSFALSFRHSRPEFDIPIVAVPWALLTSQPSGTRARSLPQREYRFIFRAYFQDEAADHRLQRKATNQFVKVASEYINATY
jgi:hypothetical protein